VSLPYQHEGVIFFGVCRILAIGEPRYLKLPLFFLAVLDGRQITEFRFKKLQLISVMIIYWNTIVAE